MTVWGIVELGGSCGDDIGWIKGLDWLQDGDLRCIVLYVGFMVGWLQVSVIFRRYST